MYYLKLLILINMINYSGGVFWQAEKGGSSRDLQVRAQLEKGGL